VEQKVVVRYSEAFKLQVLRELEEGRFGSRSAAERAYGIKGKSTVVKWIRKYGKTNLQSKVIHVQEPKEVDEIRALRKQVRELKEALADAHIDIKLGEAYLELACEAAGIEDVEGFKKKSDGKR
jgi:transposase-like protein